MFQCHCVGRIRLLVLLIAVLPLGWGQLQLYLSLQVTLLFTPQLLTRLLKSNHPEDLQAANRLIKNLVKEVGISAASTIDLAFDRADSGCGCV